MKYKNDVHIHNDKNLENSWAESAFQYAESFEKLIFKTEEGKLKAFRFTANDDKIFDKYKKLFPKVKVDVLNVDELKSQANKSKWYEFLEANKHIVKEYNLGTLIRINSQEKFGPQNSVVVPRLQYYCIELQRFREGFNQQFKAKFQQDVKVEENVDLQEQPAAQTDEMNALLKKVENLIDTNKSIDKK
ncbi:Polysaccharide_biosynthesis family protein [Hexamita inflata]|uniref:Polysaccharide biosynthesis family protein n=1 Tax=Hexamita inflata TaxID=28002 RepID=A0AA86UYF0_9EUKA|nr:Polysaccharide biosynthesis family protein [Hexamita inflata]CAI9969476.1 Polysaccharide biosynthesis family protein [Hexamita inflata]